MSSNKIDPDNKRKNFELERIENERINQSEEESDQSLNGRFTKYLAFSLIVAALGSAFQLGWSTAIFNTPGNVIKAFYVQVYAERNGKIMTDTELDLYWSITNGLIPLGGMFGGLSSGFAADYFGRKNGLIMVNTFVVISSILGIISKFIKSYETVMISRFFTGVFCGLFSGILPLYLSEMPPSNLRGSVGTINQLSLVIGILVTNIMGLEQILGTPDRWPILVGLTLVPVLAHIGLFFAPESPKHLFMNLNSRERTEQVLKKLRNNDERLVRRELEELAQEKQKLEQTAQAKWADFFKNKALKRALIVTIVIQLSQQFSGINAVIFYSTQIFQSAGLKDAWPTYATIILGAVQIVMTFVCMAIVDRAGRRILLLIGMIGMSIFSFMLAITRILGTEGSWVNYLTVVAAVLYIVFFSIGPGAIPWLITSELFGSDSRGKATSIAVFTNWFANFIVTVTFPFIERGIGSYSFIIFGSLLVLFALFMLFFVPETKNKPIEEIVSMFERKFIFFPKGK